MNDFISTIRTDRLREINEKEKVGIVVSDKYSYRFIDYIVIKMDDTEEMLFGVQANYRDVFFYIIDEGANTYFTFIEIYAILKRICDSGNEDIVIDTLDKMKNTEMKRIQDLKDPTKEIWENCGDFVYRGIDYHLKKVIFPEYDGKVVMEDGARDISYKQLFTLLNLIQEKSNAFFTRGETKKEVYVNGLIRLLICLLKLKEDHELLEDLGWKYDNEKGKFIHNKLVGDKEVNNSRKYYLTEVEYESIIILES